MDSDYYKSNMIYIIMLQDLMKRVLPLWGGNARWGQFELRTMLKLKANVNWNYVAIGLDVKKCVPFFK